MTADVMRVEVAVNVRLGREGLVADGDNCACGCSPHVGPCEGSVCGCRWYWPATRGRRPKRVPCAGCGSSLGMVDGTWVALDADVPGVDCPASTWSAHAPNLPEVPGG